MVFNNAFPLLDRDRTIDDEFPTALPVLDSPPPPTVLLDRPPLTVLLLPSSSDHPSPTSLPPSTVPLPDPAPGIPLLEEMKCCTIYIPHPTDNPTKLPARAFPLSEQEMKIKHTIRGGHIYLGGYTSRETKAFEM